MQTKRQEFFTTDDIVSSVRNKLNDAAHAGEKVDYITFVPDGEPTVDHNLKQEIDSLKSLGIPIAVITNGSLIGQEEVLEALARADWVSLKVDAVDDKVWRCIDRPHRSLALTPILDGMRTFARAFKGIHTTQTMLIAHINDSDAALRETADFVHSLQPSKAYLSIPTRPPAEKKACAPDEHLVTRAFQIFKEKTKDIEYLTGYEGNAFAFTGDAEHDLLSITAVHPMRDDAVDKFLKRAGAQWNVVHRMIEKELLTETAYDGKKFYVRKFNKK
jgi:wyosine [tRNA(Phe)-imidazoG37] synthetase (radical SAM superfamily)